MPVRFSTSLSTVRNHEGTPLRLVTFWPMLASTNKGNFSTQSSMSATRRSGMRTRLASGFIFSMRLALKSPTLTPRGTCKRVEKLPPRISALPEKMRLDGFKFR